MPPAEPVLDQLMTLAQVACLLGVSREAVRSRLRRAGIAPVVVASDGLARYRWGEIRPLFVILRRGPSDEALKQFDRVMAMMREQA